MKQNRSIWANLIGLPSAAWAARLTASSSGVSAIASELLGEEPGAQSAALDSTQTRIAAEWGAYDRLNLFNASAYLLFGILDPTEITRTLSVDASDGDDGPSLALVLNVARDRDQIRKALLAFASGGAAGLFQSYEALTYEITNCVARTGTKEWLVEQGWITDEEDERFLRTVLHYRRDDGRALAFEPFSPNEAQLFVRGVLINFVRRYAQAPPS
jgi:hypothetical protein